MIKKMMFFLMILTVVGFGLFSFVVQAQEDDYLCEISEDDYEQIQSSMSEILSSIDNEKELFGLKDVDFSNIRIGNELSTYKVVDGELLKTKIIIFPILNEGEMVSQFLVCKDDKANEWYVQLDSTLVEKTNENVQNQAFCYIYDDNGVYTYSYDGIRIVAENPEQKENESSEHNVISDVSALAFDELIVANAEKFNVDISLVNKINVLTRSATLPNISAYLNVPVIQQPSSTDICWAIAMTSIINYIKDTSYSYMTVWGTCNGYVNEGATTSTVVSWLNTHYGMGYVKGGANPTPATIVDELLAGYPSYAKFRTALTDGDYSYHAVVIRGCNVSNKTFSVMNPNPSTSGYTAGNILSGNVYRFISSYSSNVYTLVDRAYRGDI